MYCERCDKLGFDKCHCSKALIPDIVIKAKALDGGDYVPLYYDNLVMAVTHFHKLLNKAHTIEMLDNNTGEVLMIAEQGKITWEVGFIKELAN